MSRHATAAPSEASRSAVARPMPRGRAAPVTSATEPVKRVIAGPPSRRVCSLFADTNELDGRLAPPLLADGLGVRSRPMFEFRPPAVVQADAALTLALRNGDEAAVRELFERYGG